MSHSQLTSCSACLVSGFRKPCMGASYTAYMYSNNRTRTRDAPHHHFIPESQTGLASLLASGLVSD